MSYRRNLSFIAALLALSLSSFPGNTADTYTQDTMLKAIMKTSKQPKVRKCDPFIDVGCTLPKPNSPLGCTDCVPSKLPSAFIRGEKFVLPDSVDIGNRKLQLFKDPSKKDYPIFSMPAETGF